MRLVEPSRKKKMNEMSLGGLEAIGEKLLTTALDRPACAKGELGKVSTWVYDIAGISDLSCIGRLLTLIATRL